MAHIHLIVGPVGAGKSTFAEQLCHKHSTICLNLDEWMAELFKPDRPESNLMAWYAERTSRCLRQIWKLAGRLVDVGSDVVLEVGLIQQNERQDFCRRLVDSGYTFTMYVIDAPRAVRKERVEKRNREQGATFSMVVPPHIFELASDMWQPPDAAECEGLDVRYLGDDKQV